METYGLTMDEIRMASGIADEDHLRSMQNAYRELFVREETVNRKKLDTLAAIFLAMDFPDYARQAKKKKLKRKKMPGNSFFSAFSAKQKESAEYIFGILEDDGAEDLRRELLKPSYMEVDGLLATIKERDRAHKNDEIYWCVKEDGEIGVFTSLPGQEYPLHSMHAGPAVKRITVLYYYYRNNLCGYENKSEKIYASLIATLYNVSVTNGYSTDILKGRKQDLMERMESGNLTGDVPVNIRLLAKEMTDQIVKSRWDSPYVTDSTIYPVLMTVMGTEEPLFLYRSLLDRLPEPDREMVFLTAAGAMYMNLKGIKSTDRAPARQMVDTFLLSSIITAFRLFYHNKENEADNLMEELDKKDEIIRSLSEKNNALSKSLRETKQACENAAAKKIATEREHIREEVSEIYKNDIRELTERMADLKKQLKEAKEENELYEEEHRELCSLREFMFEQQKDMEDGKDIDVTADDIRELLNGRKVMVIGGHDNWINIMKKEFPEWAYFGTKVSGLKNEHFANREVIIIFTEYLSHPAYFAVMSKRRPDAKIIYCNQTNLKRAKEVIFNHL